MVKKNFHHKKLLTSGPKRKTFILIFKKLLYEFFKCYKKKKISWILHLFYNIK